MVHDLSRQMKISLKKQRMEHYHVLGLNECSTEDDMKKVYCSLALQFHPDKNMHSQVTEVMRMIIKAKEILESTLRHNDGKR